MEPKRILVAEDEPGYLELIDLMLRTEGYRVTPWADGAKALQSALESPPHLVITDVRIPGLDGYHFAQSLGEKLGAATPKIIVMTSRNTQAPAEKHAAVLSGADAVVQKPFKTEEFLKVVRRLLS
ncbi:MAG: response regulator receiver protein [Elusimicrobia bacterium]|nr:MAG: response regulator receiver protein [Elusimicrobiota bacterium]